MFIHADRVCVIIWARCNCDTGGGWRKMLCELSWKSLAIGCKGECIEDRRKHAASSSIPVWDCSIVVPMERLGESLFNCLAHIRCESSIDACQLIFSGCRRDEKQVACLACFITGTLFWKGFFKPVCQISNQNQSLQACCHWGEAWRPAELRFLHEGHEGPTCPGSWAKGNHQLSQFMSVQRVIESHGEDIWNDVKLVLYWNGSFFKMHLDPGQFWPELCQRVMIEQPSKIMQKQSLAEASCHAKVVWLEVQSN